MGAQLLFIHSELDEYGLTPDEFRIVCRIARRGECTESARNIGEGCKIGERTVRLVLRTLAAAHIIEEEDRSGQSTVRRLADSSKWKAPEKLESIRRSVLAGWKKPDAIGNSEHPEEAHPTPATVAALATNATPAMDADDPCNDCSPTPATVAAKGNPIEINPSKGKKSPNGDGAAKPQPVSETDLDFFKRRDGLMAYLTERLEGHPVGNVKGERAAALWLLKYSGFSDDEIKECLDSQLSSEWRDSVGWLTVKKDIAVYFKKKKADRASPRVVPMRRQAPTDEQLLAGKDELVKALQNGKR